MRFRDLVIVVTVVLIWAGIAWAAMALVNALPFLVLIGIGVLVLGVVWLRCLFGLVAGLLGR
jgi:hypothetical protein